jgi:NAD(P)H dehydrogenase (quinone)
LMNISIILAHPDPGSFNHAIASTAADTLRRNGHRSHLHDLCQEQFPPLLSAAELQKDAKLDPVMARHCQEIAKRRRHHHRASELVGHAAGHFEGLD